MGMKPLAATTIPPNIWPVFKVSGRIRTGFTKLRMTTVIPSTKSIAARLVFKRRVICWLAMAFFRNSILAGMSIEKLSHKSAQVYSRGHFVLRDFLLLLCRQFGPRCAVGAKCGDVGSHSEPESTSARVATCRVGREKKKAALGIQGGSW